MEPSSCVSYIQLWKGKAIVLKPVCCYTSWALMFFRTNLSTSRICLFGHNPPKKSSTFRLMFCSTPRDAPSIEKLQSSTSSTSDLDFKKTAELFYRDNFPAFGDTQRSPRNHQHDWKTFSFRKDCQMQRHQLGFNPQKTTYLFQEFWQVHNYVHTLS